MTTIGVLLPDQGAPPSQPPEALPLGQAALRLESEGVTVIFGGRAHGGRLVGLRATPGRWVPAEAPVGAVYDRFPSLSRPGARSALDAGLGPVPCANPSALVALCQDKLACQRVLEGARVPQPDLEEDPSRFVERLAAWGAAFLKPRYGAFGRGVRRVVPGDPLPARGEGSVAGVVEPLLLQRAVPPPPGWAGISLRALVQREGSAWIALPIAARRHRTDPVVNAARGADVVPAEDVLDPTTLALARERALAAAEALGDDPFALELGVDLVVGEVPVVIEVNGKPRGRLANLAAGWPDRFGLAFEEAALRPLRELARLAG